MEGGQKPDHHGQVNHVSVRPGSPSSKTRRINLNGPQVPGTFAPWTARIVDSVADRGEGWGCWHMATEGLLVYGKCRELLKMNGLITNKICRKSPKTEVYVLLLFWMRV